MQQIKDLEEHLQFIVKTRFYGTDYILHKSFNLGIFKENEFIGVCGFNYFLWHIPNAEIGYWWRISAQKKGYMLKAVHALTMYGAEEIGLKRIVITCLDDNKVSAVIPEKLGFQLDVRALGLMENTKGETLTMARSYVK